ncbi:hypothetical protein AB0C29_12285 [Actinoplanes sp. NPDC048791]|uniref:hypothetical protein n=1 Tax=Actinoplanes sp. NPDC048791 TaxID=3154623 RepID=UPI0033E5EB1E
MTTGCAVCPTTTDTAEGWTSWLLLEDIRWRSAFTHTGEEPPTPAGVYHLCPTCTAWLPRARTAPVPAAATAGLDQVELHPTTKHRLRAELVGRIRHLGRQLRPIPTTRED